MADNVPITPGSGAEIATDDVDGVQFQRVKVNFGAEGQATDVSPANPLPVTAPTDFPDIASLAKLEAIRAALVAGIPVSGTFWQPTQPVTVTTLPLPTGASTDATLQQVRDRLPATPHAQPLTDAQLRATAVPVSMAGASTEATLAQAVSALASILTELQAKTEPSDTQIVANADMSLIDRLVMTALAKLTYTMSGLRVDASGATVTSNIATNQTLANVTTVGALGYSSQNGQAIQQSVAAYQLGFRRNLVVS